MLPSNWPKTSGIYKVFFLDPDLFYIGSATNLRMRWSLHRRQLQKGVHHNIHLQRAYAKYGEDALHFEIVEHIERREDLIPREQHYLDTLKPHFNILKNAKNMLGLKHTEETKAKLRATNLGKSPPNKGKPMPIEQRQYYSDLYTGKPHGHRTSNGHIPWNRGKSLSPQAKVKIGAANVSRNSVLAFQSMTPEQKAQRQKKSRTTIRNMSPERKAEMWSKGNATKAANRLANPPKWATRYDACIECGTMTSRHVGYGLCEACYSYKRRHKQ